MITQEDLFMILSDSDFMKSNQISFNALHGLVDQLMSDLKSDDFYLSLVKAQQELENSINIRVSQLIDRRITTSNAFVMVENDLTDYDYDSVAFQA